ncbi:MAG: hypothetical protein PHD67_06850 [Oscillospiraceae bacterium]|nr:hypothetical protein [Oscillospiraceae bacterium]
MNIYFGNTTATVTTLLLLGLVAFVVWSIMSRANIQHWGWRVLFLAVYGLLVCCFAAARDGLDKTIQCAIDGSCAPGIFQLISIPNIIGCIGALLIIVAGIVTLCSRSQHTREIMFYMMSGGAILKIVTIEIARIIL